MKKIHLFFAFLFFLIIFCFECAVATNIQNTKETSNLKGKKNVIIAFSDGLVVFNGSDWSKIPFKESFLLNADDNGNVLIATDSFFGKVHITPNHQPSIEVLLKNRGKWGHPEKLFTLGNQTYMATRNFLFRFSENKIYLIDSVHNGILPDFSQNTIYIVQKNKILSVSKDYQFDTIYLDHHLVPSKAIIDNVIIVPIDKSSGSVFLGWMAFVIYTSILFVIYVVYKKIHHIKTLKGESKMEQIVNERTAELINDKEKTDNLLAKLLPKDKVDELKNTGKAASQKFEMVTVLFSDIQGFTKIAEQMNPEKLIDELDNFFLHFDLVVEKYNIEKIKTIGDAYMCAGGIPYRNRTNPVEVVLAALEMQDYMKQLREKDINIWDLRIGIHTGPVIAGIVGNKRMSYDIWGDSVNTASRMESSGEAGKVNISGHTYDLVKEYFVCEYRGRMPVKYKGEIDMYFVKSIRPELCEGSDVNPNKQFFLYLQLLRLFDLEYYVMEKLNSQLPDGMSFHNASFTEDVFLQTELIGRSEKLNTEEMLCVRTAALLVNTGYIVSYDNYVSESDRFALEILPKFRYTDNQISKICELLHSYHHSSKASDKITAVLIDAYHSYYGRQDYVKKTMNLYNEVKLRKPSLTEKEWLGQQIKVLEKFQFHTATARLLSELSPEQQIQKIKDFSKIH